MDNYQTIANRLSGYMEFRGNSMRGVWEYKDGNESHLIYRIYSYSTVIATYDFPSMTPWVTDRKYSVTTTRQTNLIKRVWGIK